MSINYSKIANSITISRIIISIPLTICLSHRNLILSLILISIAGIGDFLDGWIARKFGSCSRWGARMDPLADKILILAPIIWLSSIHYVPFWSVWVIVCREILITGWRTNLKQDGSASYLAKIKTTLQYISTIILILSIYLNDYLFSELLNNIGLLMYWAALIFSIYSATKYITYNQESYQ